MMFSPYLWLAVLLTFIGVAIGGYEYGESVQKDADQVAADQLKIAAAKTLQDETEKVSALQSALAEAANVREKESLDHAQALKDAAARSDSLVAAAGGLRDPGRRGIGGGCSQGQLAVAASRDAGAPAGSRLSDELAGFLFSEADRADQIVVRLQACEGYASDLRERVNTK